VTQVKAVLGGLRPGRLFSREKPTLGEAEGDGKGRKKRVALQVYIRNGVRFRSNSKCIAGVPPFRPGGDDRTYVTKKLQEKSWSDKDERRGQFTFSAKGRASTSKAWEKEKGLKKSARVLGRKSGRPALSEQQIRRRDCAPAPTEKKGKRSKSDTVSQ